MKLRFSVILLYLANLGQDPTQDLIHALYLTISPRVVRGALSMDNHEFGQELCDNLINEIGATVGHHLNRASKLGNYLLINELNGIVSIKFSDKFGFGPFGHVVRGYYDISSLAATGCWLDRANII